MLLNLPNLLASRGCRAADSGTPTRATASAITNQKQDRDFRGVCRRAISSTGEARRARAASRSRGAATQLIRIRVKVVYSPSSPAFQLSQIAKRDAGSPLGDGNSTYIFKPTAQRDGAMPVHRRLEFY